MKAVVAAFNQEKTLIGTFSVIVQLRRLIVFNYEKAYFILDEYLMAGEIVETSKKSILNAIRLQDFLQEEETPQGLFEDAGLG